MFAAIFMFAALLLHFAFVEIVDQQAITRVEDVARAGLRSVLFGNHTLKIDESETSNEALLRRDQGLQWFDQHGRLIDAQGLNPLVEAPPADGFRQLSSELRIFDSFAMPILSPQTHERLGTVRASQWDEQKRQTIGELDTGLLLGTLIAIIGSAAGGLALARRAVRPIAKSLEVLREFSADASHELRGPLTAIASNADAALRDADRDPVQDRSRFEAIADGAKQMSRLTSDLLLLASTDRSLERELFAVDLSLLLGKLEDRYREPFAEAGIGLSFSVEKLTLLYGNPDQIERIFANLIDNALSYTPFGGRVSVESTRHRGTIRITVRDSGIGIAPEHLNRVFDRFWRAEPARSRARSGLGLAIARALARRHGGDVTVRSKHGYGSTFVASFPDRPVRKA